MNDYNPYVVKIFSELTDAVKVALNREKLMYAHGFIEEVNNTLTELSKTPTTDSLRYPVIILVQPFTVSKGKDYYELKGAKVLIAINTISGKKAADRYTANFYPILFPIYNALLEEMARHRYIEQPNPNEIQHDLIELPFYGVESGGTASVFSDMIDCLMIDNLQLKIKQKNSC